MHPMVAFPPFAGLQGMPSMNQPVQVQPIATNLGNLALGINPLANLQRLALPAGYQNYQLPNMNGYSGHGLTGLGGFNVQQGLSAFNLGLGAYAAAAAAGRGQPLVSLFG